MGHGISKKYIGFYPGEDAENAFSDRLSEYGFDKGNIRIRNYKVGDSVKFKIRYHDSDREEIHGGVVEIIEH